MASSMCSVETYSSLNFSASSKAFSRISLAASLRNSLVTPLTLGRRANSVLMSCAKASGRTPRRLRSGGTTPSRCATRAARRCKGSSCCWPYCSATACAFCWASCAFTVSLSYRNMAFPFPHEPRRNHGQRAGPEHPGPTFPETVYSLLAVARNVDLHLFGLGLFALGQVHGQDALLVVGADGFYIDGVRQRKRPGERAVGALDPEVILLVHTLLELAFATDGQCVVFQSNVDVLFLDARQVHLGNQLVLALVNVHCRRPRRQVSFTGAALRNGTFKKAVDLILKSGQAAEWVPTCDCAHDVFSFYILLPAQHIICAYACQ